MEDNWELLKMDQKKWKGVGTMTEGQRVIK